MTDYEKQILEEVKNISDDFENLAPQIKSINEELINLRSENYRLSKENELTTKKLNELIRQIKEAFSLEPIFNENIKIVWKDTTTENKK